MTILSRPRVSSLRLRQAGLVLLAVAATSPPALASLSHGGRRGDLMARGGAGRGSGRRLDVFWPFGDVPLWPTGHAPPVGSYLPGPPFWTRYVPPQQPPPVSPAPLSVNSPQSPEAKDPPCPKYTFRTPAPYDDNCSPLEEHDSQTPSPYGNSSPPSPRNSSPPSPQRSGKTMGGESPSSGNHKDKTTDDNSNSSPPQGHKDKTIDEDNSSSRSSDHKDKTMDDNSSLSSDHKYKTPDDDDDSSRSQDLGD